MRKILLGISIGVLLNWVAAIAKENNADLEALITRHLRAVGPEATLAAVKTRVAEGTSQYKVRIGGTADLEGKAALVSEGQQKVRFLLRYSDPRYPGENCVTDGKEFRSYHLPRSPLGQLIYDEDPLLRDGLLGGVLTTVWPFFSQDRHKAKLSYVGLVDIDGKKLHEIRYQPKRRSNLKVSLYFDPDTSQHVLSVYTVELIPKLLSADAPNTGQLQLPDDNPGQTSMPGANPELANSQQQIVRYRLEERFGDFRELNGLTLPTKWNMKLSMEGYKSLILYYDVKFDHLEDNLGLDPRNFAIK